MILRSSFPKFHYYRNKRLQVKESQYLILTYSWTLISIPNWTCSAVTISPFDARLLSMWLTNCADPSTRLQSPTREGCWLQSFSVHPNDEDQEELGHKTLRCTNTTTSSHERWIRANSVSGHNLLEQILLNTCAACFSFDGP